MKQTLKEKIQAKLANSEGFTLLEILVVLTIMGFLIAMVAPRLAGISGGAVDTVCDSNQNRMISMMSGYYEKTNRYPNKMTNLVEETAAGVYQIPAISDDDPENGAETIASEFNSRNHFRIHYLDAAEVAELKNLGITKIYNLNSYDGYLEDGSAVKTGYDNTAGVNNDVALAATVTKAPTMEEFTLDVDVTTNPIAVMMVGGGSDAAAVPVWTIESGERGWGEGDFFGRIVFGFGPENSLVTSGIVSNAAHCPGGIQNADNVTYNDYNLVLPRLQSTVDKYDATVTAMDSDATTGGVQLAAVGYDEDTEPAAAYDYVANADNLKVRTYDLVGMESFQFATMCPEGHKFPADDGDYWGLDINAGATLD